MDVIFKRADLVDAGWDIELIPGEDMLTITKPHGDKTSSLFAVASRGEFLEVPWPSEHVDDFPYEKFAGIPHEERAYA
jgi:hypothetical protein